MKKLFYLFALIASLLFTSCGSDITTTVTRPAELDLNGAKSISVLPFQTHQYASGKVTVLSFFDYLLSDTSEPAQQVVDYITSGLTNSLLNSGFLNVVGSKRVETALNNGYEIPCDVYLAGYISHFDNSISERWDDVKETYYYKRSVSFTVTYEVIDARTNYVLSRKYQDISDTSYETSSRRDIPSAVSLVRDEIDSMVKKIMRQLEPYQELKEFTLLDDKAKSPDMKAARKIANDGYLDLAYQQYNSIYNSRGLFEAGYNCAIILEAFGNYDEAEALMTDLYMKTADKRAATALNDIRKERSSVNALHNQMILRNTNN